MTVAAAVQYTQGVTVGTAGQALFGATGTNVTVANGNNTNVNKWTFIVIDVPPGSSVPVGQVQSGALSTWTFAPDVTGGYLVQIIVTNTIDGSTATDTRCFGVKEVSGRFVPPFKATDVMLNFAGQTRGWAPYMETWLAYIDTLGGSLFTTADYPAQTTNKTITQTIGWIYVGFQTLGSGLSCIFPSSPQSGMIVTVAAEDNSFHTENITLNGSGKNFQYGDAAPASSYVMTWGVFGNGGASTWRYNGTLWKYIS